MASEEIHDCGLVNKVHVIAHGIEANENLGYVVRIQAKARNEVCSLLFTSERAVKETKMWPEALTFDATYKTNAHRMSLANIVGTSNVSLIRKGNKLAVAADLISSKPEAIYT